MEWNRGGACSSGVALPSFGPVGARQFRMEELEQVTNQFSESNLIGYGSFGSVYKGFLRDGTIVAVKKRAGAPKQEFAGEVHDRYICVLYIIWNIMELIKRLFFQ